MKTERERERERARERSRKTERDGERDRDGKRAMVRNSPHIDRRPYHGPFTIFTICISLSASHPLMLSI